MNVGKSQKLDSGDTAYRYFNFTLLNKTGDLSDLNQNKSSEDFTISNYGITDEAIINVPVLVVSKEPDAVPPTITVDGGEWTGSDGSGTPGEQTTLVKETPYDTKLTVAGPTDLADMTGSVLMTDGTGAPGPYSQTPYKLVTTDIESVETGYGTATQYTSYQFAGQGVTIVFSYTQID